MALHIVLVEPEIPLIQRSEQEKISFGNDLLGVIVGKNIDDGYLKRIKELCDNNKLPCFLTYIMDGKNCIQFVPIEKKNDFHTPYEIYAYMREKEEQGKCKDNEIYLFNKMNDELIRL